MSKVRFRDDFKRDAVRQITNRGYPVAEVSQRLTAASNLVSTVSFPWKRKSPGVPGLLFAIKS